MNQTPRARLALLLPLAILTLLLAASCTSTPPRLTETPTVTPIPATATPAGPTATPTPDLAVLLKDGGIAIIRTAYDRLLDEYIEPLKPNDVLAEAWAGAASEAAAEGIAVPARPALSGDREGDFAAFRDAYVPLAASGDATKLRYAALRTMAQSLHDCHTFFLSPVAADTINETREGQGSVGIGVELGGPPPLVTGVIGGGPADRAGIRVGDRIARIDDADASQLGPASAFELINGKEDTTVRLQLRRPGEAAPVELAITRARVIPQNVEPRVLGGGIGYVRVRNFVQEGIHGPLRDALTSFEAQGVTRWIIDLRDDPGGQFDGDAISLFVKDGVTTRTRNRDGKLDETRASGETLPVVRPMVLLTNNGTGSVAEAFAAALQEYGVAYVIGAKTNGCVGYTDIGDLGDGSSMAVTTHVNLGPVTNKLLNGVGVIPDEPVTRTQSNIVNGVDPQLDAAIAHLGG
ncbi:MAG: PDZ domain-containing protein [Dehalococcoidia bacterium]|nr:MAG: PDZ domain-containing protein [Dehalococcoidia bacterium]